MADESRNDFLGELKRRSVFRVGAAYLVAAWLLIQIADTVFPYLGLSDGAIARIIMLLAIGFVPALIFAWIFEWTPEGLKRDRDVRQDIRGPSGIGRRIDYVIMAMLTVAVAIFSYDRFVAPLGGGRVTVIANEHPAIAVLPFENRSARDEDVYFVDGIHDDILTSLAKIGSLQVISRTSVEQYRDTDKTIREIADELGVTAILEGGVQRAGERIRVNVQLIDAATDVHQWAENFDRELTTSDIFSIQSEIANTIAVALRAELSPAEMERIDDIPTDSLAAYEAYLLGSHRLRQRGLAVEEAAGYFREAVELDPEFALAFVGLADSYQLMRTHTARPWDELRPPALAAAERAIELDPNLGEAYVSLAMIHHESRDEELAGPLFRHGLELSPNYATGHQWYSEHLSRAGDNRAALDHIETAHRLDPLSPIINHIYSRRLAVLGDFEGAEMRLLKAIEIDPAFARAHQGLATLYLRELGRLDDAAIMAYRATRLNPEIPSNYALLANILLNLGDLEGAERWIDRATDIEPTNWDVGYVRASIDVAAGRWAQAAEVSRQALERFPRGGMHTWIVSTSHLREGRTLEALAAFEIGFPGLLDEEDPVVSRRNIGMAPHVIRVLQIRGETERAERLLRKAEDFYLANRDSGFYLGLLTDVRLHALAGETDEALAAMRAHIDAGWRYLALNFFDRTPSLDAIRDDPRFTEMANEVKTDLAAQRESLRRKWAAELD
jgi:TolB-like protein/Flp pilus assembly protein TadD